MKTYIALLRGINVVGNNSLPMQVLVALLEDLGCGGVRTYIQSGNAVFHCAPRSTARLASQIGLAVKQCRGFEPHVLLLELKELEQAMARNPFPEAVSDPKSLHLGFLASAPPKPDLKTLDVLKTPSERFRLIDRTLYLHLPQGMGKSKLAANAERRLGVAMTLRNWRTVCKVRELAAEPK